MFKIQILQLVYSIKIVWNAQNATNVPLYQIFPCEHPIRSTVQEPNARLYTASAAAGIDYEVISTIMASLFLSITTKKHFIEQTHRVYSNLHEFAQKQFQSLANKIFKDNFVSECDRYRS